MTPNFSRFVERSWNDQRLLSALLELTYDCSWDCVFCYNDVSVQGKELSEGQYISLLNELEALNVLQLVLSGGEPLLSPHFWSIACLAKEKRICNANQNQWPSGGC